MTGRGSGLSDDGLIRKVQVIHSAIACNRPNAENPLDVMSKLGSLDIAAMCGVFLGGAACGVPVATMQPSDDESLRRIDRHRALREDKGFKTLECYTDLETAAEGLPCYGGILLECLGNYLASCRSVAERRPY